MFRRDEEFEMPDGDNGNSRVLRLAMSATISDNDLDALTSSQLKDRFETVMGQTTLNDNELETLDELEAESLDQEPVFLGKTIYEKLAAYHDEAAGKRAERYVLGPLLGSGSGGIVYDMEDCNFRRIVAVKMMPRSRAQVSISVNKFIHEALIVGQLDHPNILPVYDMDTTDDGLLFYTMKKVDGCSLEQFLYEDIPLEFAQELATPDDIARVFLRVAEALSYAHSREVIHQDIKPSNIMIGNHGEVCVVDWGSAVDCKSDELEPGRLVGTPLYMSPEQARREKFDYSSDIYCLGASMFHLLYARPVLADEDMARFWERKRNGDYDVLSDVERAAVPPVLSAICEKCIEGSVANRYQSMDLLIQDLKDYLAGLPVDAYSYGFTCYLSTWMQRNKLRIFTLIVFVLLTAASLTFWYNEHLKEQSGWGVPVFVETFDNDVSWTKNWIAAEGTYTIADGKLVTKDGPSFYALYNKRINGSVAIEFDGEILKDSPPCDLSVVYCSDYESEQGSGIKTVFKGKYLLQNGAFTNTCSMIKGPNGRLDYSDNILQSEVKYRVRAEIEGVDLKLFLNDRLVCSHELMFPLTSGYVGVYAYYQGKSIDNVKVYSKNVAEEVRVMDTGDLLYYNELYDQAAVQYEKIYNSDLGKELSDEARYKQALCVYHMGDTERAFRLWDPLNFSSYRPHIRMHLWDQWIEERAYGKILHDMNDLYPRVDLKTKKNIHDRWGAVLYLAVKERQLHLVESFYLLRKKYFPNDQTHTIALAYALMTVGPAEELMNIFPGQEIVHVEALYAMGRYAEVESSHKHMHKDVALSLVQSGKFDAVIEGYSDIRSAYLDALIASEEIEKAKSEFANDTLNLHLLMQLGDYAEVMSLYPDTASGGILASAYLDPKNIPMFLGSQIKVAGSKDLSDNEFDLTSSDAFLRYVSADSTADKTEVLDELAGLAFGPVNYDLRFQSSFFAMHFLNGMLQFHEGNTAVIRNRLETIWSDKKELYGLRLWYSAALILGKISQEEFMDQPRQFQVAAAYELCAGLASELAGDRADAQAHYSAYLALPHSKRSISLTDKLYMKWIVEGN